MGVGQSAISFPEGDPIRTYSDDEKRRLTANLEQLLREVHAGEFTEEPASQSLLCDLHRAVFGGVREHAGKCRNSTFGSEFLTFGPNRSVHRDEVERELERVFRDLSRFLRSLEENWNAPDYDEKAIYICVWAHAEVIRVHPFEDGNGRTSRALLSMLLVRVGLTPIPIEAVKEEYTEALNEHFRTRSLRVLLDLYLRLYPLP